MFLWKKIGLNDDTVFKDKDTVDYSKINDRWFIGYIELFKSMGICNDCNIGICIHDDSIIMPLILSMYNFDITLKFMNFKSMRNLVLENYFNCDFYITDFKCNVTVDIINQVEFNLYGKVIYLYRFHCQHSVNEDRYKKRYIYYTSGTSGIPKEVYKSENAVKAEAEYFIKETGLKRGDRILCMAPCSHVYAQCIACWAAALVEAEVTYLPSNILLSQLMREIENNYYDILLSTPFFYNELYEQLLQKQEEFKLLLCAGAFPSEQVLNSDLKINYVYGTTETGIIATQMYRDGYSKGSVGHPIKGVKIILGNEVYENDKIRMYQFSITSPYTGYKYVQDGQTIDFQDTIVLSDYGYIDNQGEVFLKGRIDNIININGEKVSSTEIEAVLNDFFEVKEAKVVKENNEKGEFPVAYIVPNDKYQKDKHLLERIIKKQFLEKSELYKLPKKFIFLKELKKTSTGKILLNQ